MVKKKFHVVFVFRSLTLLKVAVGHQFCPIQVSVAGAQMQLKDLVCNASMLRQFLTVDGGEASMNDLQTQLCNLPADILQEAERLFLSQLDFTKYFTVGIGEQGNLQKYTSSPLLIQWILIQFSACFLCVFLVYLMSYSISKRVCASCQRDRMMANAADLRVISQAVTSVSQELAVLIDDVRAHLIFHVQLCILFKCSPVDWTAFFWRCCMFAFIMNKSTDQTIHECIVIF